MKYMDTKSNIENKEFEPIGSVHFLINIHRSLQKIRKEEKKEMAKKTFFTFKKKT
jgi:hypothetical protein